MPAMNKVVRSACIVAGLFAWHGAALAEVCDKAVLVPASWQASMGPHSLLLPAPRLAPAVVVAGLVALVVRHFALRRVAMLIAAVLGAMALLTGAWAFSGGLVDKARPDALAEGCYSVSADVFSAFIFIAGAVLFGVIGTRRDTRVRS